MPSTGRTAPDYRVLASTKSGDVRVVHSNFLHVITLDGAGWHQPGGRLRIPSNISLLPLPPYSPQLNPVENVWQFLRQNHLSNRVWETYDAIVDACCDAWNAIVAEPERITSIATRKWAQVKT